MLDPYLHSCLHYPILIFYIGFVIFVFSDTKYKKLFGKFAPWVFILITAFYYINTDLTAEYLNFYIVGMFISDIVAFFIFGFILREIEKLFESIIRGIKKIFGFNITSKESNNSSK